jgi:hypothetical protein
LGQLIQLVSLLAGLHGPADTTYAKKNLLSTHHLNNFSKFSVAGYLELVSFTDSYFQTGNDLIGQEPFCLLFAPLFPLQLSMYQS